MRDRKLEEIVERRGGKSVPFHSLMSRRVRNVLLVSSLYDSYTLEEDGRFTEVLFSEYLSLNLRYAPRIVRVSTGDEALERLDREDFDLVISMLDIGPMQADDLGRALADRKPRVPYVLLAYTGRDIRVLEEEGRLDNVDGAYIWQGDVRLFLAMIKSVEDMLNAEHDSRAAGVKCIILVEDSVRFRSSYLPILYTELMQQTQALMTEGVNQMQKLMRMRARPKILCAGSYEDALELYGRFRDNVLGMILDVRFPKDGVEYPRAGFSLAEEIKADNPECPLLFQSSEEINRARAGRMGAAFIDKNSPTLLAELRDFMREYLGFGEFVFRNPDGREEARASDLRELRIGISEISDGSLLYHAGRNDFSTWLMARTEFDLARALRPRRVDDFESAEELRSYLLSSLKTWIERSRAGQVEDFSREKFDSFTEFTKIGSGSLGGKGRGLAFMNALLNTYRVDDGFPGIDIRVPPTAVVGTGVFDRFMEGPGLKELAFRVENAEAPVRDAEVAAAFLGTPFPADTAGMLRAFLEKVEYPLAVRSSSLLEDSPSCPFAGMYSTYMLPNSSPNIEVRLAQLLDAVRLVYASTYYSEPAAYMEKTPNRLEEEKMAVVIQQLVAQRHGDVFYPGLAGVARSRNFYPLEGMREESGVASVVLGLGGPAVSGGRSVRFSPDAPGKLYQFSSTEETLRNSQRHFLALDMKGRPGADASDPAADMNLVRLDLERAQADGTLAPVGSVYSAENDTVMDGTFRPGVKLVTMAGVLKGDFFPLAPLLRRLLDVGRVAFAGDVEMEFAVNLGDPDRGVRHEFGFLQIRPMGHAAGTFREIDLSDRSGTVCISGQALGFGSIENVMDILYVRSSSFERNATVEIAEEIGRLNGKLRRLRRNTLLIGPGRWGSSDRWLGIPVRWDQISSVRCIVETPLEDMDVSPSQGTHFFQNITSLGIGYFTVRKNSGDYLDTEFLEEHSALKETEHVRHIHLYKPLSILIDARSRNGIIRLT